MTIEYGICGAKNISFTKKLNIGNEMKECKDLENFTKDEFSSFAKEMVESVSSKASGLSYNTESFVKFPSGLISKTPVKNFEELQEAYKTDFELYKDRILGKIRYFKRLV